MLYNQKTQFWFGGFLGMVLVILLPAIGSSAPLPYHRIAISFDFPNHRIYGTVDATVPYSVKTFSVGKDLRITRFSINGKKVRARVKDGHLRLPSHPDMTQVHVEYEAVFSRGGNDLDANTIQKEGGFLFNDWYPSADAELARFSLKAKIPGDFHAVSEADNVSSMAAGENKLVFFDFPHPVPRIHLVVAPYIVTRDHYGKVEVETYFLPEDQGLASRYLEYTKNYLALYENLLGPYPFRRFVVVENILPTGYGMPTFTLLGRQVLKLPFIPETSLGHEILHSWFGNSVYVDYQKGNWSEGLTTYLSDHYYDEQKKKGWQHRRRLLENFESYVHADNEISVREFTGGGDRATRAVGYGKTAMIFHMLKNRIGDEAFETGLKFLVKEQLFRVTSWQDIERVLSKTAGEDLSGFFTFWLDGKGMMEMNMDRIILHRVDRGYHLEFRVRMANALPPVTVQVVTHGAGKSEKRSLSLSDVERNFTLSLEEIPQQIVLDPDYDLFRSLYPAERRPVLSRLLGDPTRTVVLPKNDRKTYDSLVKQLERKGFRAVPAKEITHSEMAESSLLFLGPQPEFGSLFTQETDARVGFSLQLRKNTFSSRRVHGLALARDPEEVNRVTRKLFHYGQYSMLEFSGGKTVKKETSEGAQGISRDVPSPVTGIAVDAVLHLPEIISRIADKPIVYVGEKHDRYGDHLIQLDVIKGLHQRHPKLAIGMEMFQRRYQEALDEYISGAIDEQTFLRRSHYFTTWRFNYYLYRDILLYARANKIPVIALNQDNELVSKVAEVGIEKLRPEERAKIPEELVFEDAEYEKRIRRVFEVHQTDLPGSKAPRVFEYFYQAQLVWDETMAETISTFVADHPDYHLVILAGNGHLEYGSGIPKRARRRSGKDYATVLPAPGEPVEAGLADFIVFPSTIEASEPPKLGVMLDTSEDQLKVTGFTHGSGAKAAGMAKGDIIRGVDGQQVENIDDLKASLFIRQVGDTLGVMVQRGTKELELKVKLGLPTVHRR